VHLRLLGVNDFHGTLEPPGSLRRRADGRRISVGGAATLESHLDRAALPGRTVRVHAGDMVGASPLISSHFHDEPSVEAMNLMGFDVGTLGNHEFDEGPAELMRLLRGGRRRGAAALKRDARGRLRNTSSSSFRGAAFPYVAANTVDRRGRLLLPPYRIVTRAGVKLGFIGVTTETTPDYLLARHRSGLRFLDISRAVNRWVPALRRRGVRAIVVLAHSGAFHLGPTRAAGEIVDEARQMSDDVDVVIAGHTHSRLNLRVGRKLVVEAFSYGTAYDKVDISVDRRSGEVLASRAETPRTWSDQVAPDREVASLVRRYARLVAPLAGEVLGSAPGGLAREEGLGELVAEAQRALAHADIAVVNPGNMRSDLDPGRVTYEGLFDVQRYEHRIVRLDMTGAQVRALLQEQFESIPPVRLHVSGLRYEETNGRVGRIMLAGGRELDPTATYAIAANELIATGERFDALREGARRRRPVGTDLEALARFVAQRRGPLG
jgi:5'-nucleotidase